MTRDYARYGIDPEAAIYRPESHTAPRYPSCFCGQHAEKNRRANCDLQAARALEMADPVWCVYCAQVYERSEVEALPDAQMGRCNTCAERLDAQCRPVRRRRSPATLLGRAQWLNPGVDLHGMSRDQIALLALDEVAS